MLQDAAPGMLQDAAPGVQAGRRRACKQDAAGRASRTPPGVHENRTRRRACKQDAAGRACKQDAAPVMQQD
jgi:hypothetical protein